MEDAEGSTETYGDRQGHKTNGKGQECKARTKTIITITSVQCSVLQNDMCPT